MGVNIVLPRRLRGGGGGGELSSPGSKSLRRKANGFRETSGKIGALGKKDTHKFGRSAPGKISSPFRARSSEIIAPIIRYGKSK